MNIIQVALLVEVSVATSTASWDYCGTDEIPPYFPADTSIGELVSVDVFFRHGMRSEYRRTSCFKDGLQPKFACGLVSEFGVTQITSCDNEQIGENDHCEFGSIEGQRSSFTKQYKDGCELGQILDYASTQMNRLGDYLVGAYGKYSFFDDRDNHTLYLRSTDTQRTLGSLDLLLKALYKNRRNVVHQSPTFSVETDNAAADSLLLSTSACDRATQIDSSFLTSKPVIQLMQSAESQSCFDSWKTEIGTEFSVADSADCLFAPLCAEIPFPGGIKISDSLISCTRTFFVKLRQIRYGYGDTSTTFPGKEYCMLAIAPFVFELYERRKAVSADLKNGGSLSSKHSRMGLYATHDDTISCMLSSFGLWDGRWTKYAGFIAIEQYSSGKVRILQDGLELKWFDRLDDFITSEQRSKASLQQACAVKDISSVQTAPETNGIEPGLSFTSVMLRILGLSSIVGVIASL